MELSGSEVLEELEELLADPAVLVLHNDWRELLIGDKINL